MKKFFLALLLIISLKGYAFALTNIYSADSTGKVSQTKPLKTIWLNTGQLIFHREIQLGFERSITPKISLEGMFGYKYAVKEDQEYELCVGCMTSLSNYYDNVARIPFSNGLLASIALKAYIKKAPGFYFSPQLFYRYWFYNHQYLNYGGYTKDDENIESQQSLRMHVAGFKLLAGYSFPLIRFTPEHKLVADVYSGLGFRQKYVTTYFDWSHDRNQNYGTHYIKPPYTNRENKSIISLQLGAKLGFMF